MSNVFTNRNGRTWATHLDSPAGRPTMGDKKTEPSAARSWSAAPRDPGPAPAASGEPPDRLIGSSGHRAIDRREQTSDQAIPGDRVVRRPAEQDKTDRWITGSSDQPISSDQVNSAENRSSNQHRIRIDVPMGTSYLEIQASIFRQAWQLAGTQLRAAIALGITPETISRALRACDRKRIGSPRIPKAWPGVEIDRSIGSSGHRGIEPLKTQAGDQPMNRWTDEPINEEEELKIDD
jgi:hypothetical protein